MNVLILEIGGSHIECTYSFLHILKSKGHNVSLCCNEDLIQSFPERKLLTGELLVPNIIKPHKQLAVLWRIRQYIIRNNISHLVVNTSEIKLIRNLIFFLPSNLNCTGLVHNAKKLESGQTFIKILSKKMLKYFVLGEYLLENLQPHSVFKVAPFFPIYFPKPKPQNISKPNGEFWVIIPGSVLQSRRDYVPLLNQLKSRECRNNIRFVFLGNFDSTVSEDVALLLNGVNNLITFNHFLDYDFFHNYMQLADVILPLIKLEGDEMYADGRISGSYNLGLAYQLPFFLPQQMHINKDLADYSIYYNSMQQLMEELNLIASSSTKIESIKTAYASGPFSTNQPYASEICDFIESI
jgi:hypothetical protein